MGQDKGNCMYGNAYVVGAMGDSADGSYVGKATRNVCGGALIGRARYIIGCANEGGTRDGVLLKSWQRREDSNRLDAKFVHVEMGMRVYVARRVR